MSKQRTYISMLRLVFAAKSDIHASMTAEHLRQTIENEMEDDDSVDVTQTIVFGGVLKAEEIINILKRARNELVRLKYTDTMSLAQQLDMVVWKLNARLSNESEEVAPGYDYNRITTIFALLEKGEEPLI